MYSYFILFDYLINFSLIADETSELENNTLISNLNISENVQLGITSVESNYSQTQKANMNTPTR